jgi:hypothetical protein
VLRAMLDQPGRSLIELAKYLAWDTMDGKPNKQRVHRIMQALKKAKLVEMQRDGHYVLSNNGKEAAKETPELSVKVVPRGEDDTRRPV